MIEYYEAVIFVTFEQLTNSPNGKRNLQTYKENQFSR